MMKIFFGQLICGLSVLKKGGKLIMKTYTQYTPWNISLIYFLTSQFDKCYLCKPETSRQPNGQEIYLVCIDYYDNLIQTDFEKLLSILDNFNANTDFKKILISYEEMNKDSLKKIINIILQYFSEKHEKGIKNLNIKNKYLKFVKKDSKFFLKSMKKLELKTKEFSKSFYNKHFIKYEYKKINNNDKLV